MKTQKILSIIAIVLLGLSLLCALILPLLGGSKGTFRNVSSFEKAMKKVTNIIILLNKHVVNFKEFRSHVIFLLSRCLIVLKNICFDDFTKSLNFICQLRCIYKIYSLDEFINHERSLLMIFRNHAISCNSFV